MNLIARMLHIPTPMELGKSESNALPSRFFPNDDKDEYTWEDYDMEMRVKYPIRWFLTRTIPTWWRRYVWGTYAPLERFRYWVVSNTIHRYHMLDLRQPGGYRYGWLDSDSQILYANFNILENFYKNELGSLCTEFSEEEAKEEYAKQQLEFIEDVKKLHHYWTVDRPAFQKLIEAAASDACVARKAKNFAKSEEMYKTLEKSQQNFDDLETTMLMKLINIRKQMWT